MSVVLEVEQKAIQKPVRAAEDDNEDDLLAGLCGIDEPTAEEQQEAVFDIDFAEAKRAQELHDKFAQQQRKLLGMKEATESKARSNKSKPAPKLVP